MSLVPVAELQSAEAVRAHYREVRRRQTERDMKPRHIRKMRREIAIHEPVKAPVVVAILFKEPEPERHPRSLLPVTEYPPIPFIVQHVADEFGYTTLDIYSDRRFKGVALARSVCEWIARTLTPISFPQIAASMSKYRGSTRDHSTVCHSIRKIDGLRSDCPVFTARLDWLVDYIQSEWRVYNGLPEAGAGQ